MPKGSFKFEFKPDSGGPKVKFKATDFDFLVVAGDWAQFRGNGLLDGNATPHSFTVTLIDGDVPAGSGDDFARIVIEELSGAVVYDSQPGDGRGADPTTPLTKGNNKFRPNRNAPN